MLDIVISEKVQLFIKSFDVKKIHQLLLTKPVFEEISNAEIAQQILARQKCQSKLPLWFTTDRVVFPLTLSIEQASSQLTADLKSSWFSGENMIDMTGGFGVDTYFFSKRFTHVTYCEQQVELSKIVAHNFKLLSALNINFVSKDGLKYIINQDVNFDLIYIDPARRSEIGKVIRLEDSEPNFLPFLEVLLTKAQKIVVKTSPLLDISQALEELKYVTQVHINSIKNDCKELIFVLQKNHNTVPMVFVHAYTAKWQTLCLPLFCEKDTPTEVYISVQKFLYEPDVAVLKAGWFKSIASVFKLGKIAQHTHLYTAQIVDYKFIGKIFEVMEVIDFNVFKKRKIVKAHVVTKNFPLKSEEIAKKFKIKIGGDLYLFFFKDARSHSTVVFARRILMPND